MRIFWVEPHLKYGIGGIRRVISVSNSLQAKGHTVHIYHPTGRKCTWIENEIPTFKLSKLHQHPCDIVIFNLAEQYTWALKAQAKKRVFWVLAPEAEYKHPAVPIRALRKDFFYMANSKYTVHYIKRNSKIKQEIPVIPGAISREHFKRDKSMPKDFHVLYTGSKRPWKGTQLIETALNSIPNVKALRMEGLNTPQKDMWKLYNRCTCFVSACQAEGFGFPELEAMACGCPVVCTDSGGNRDFIVPAQNALVVQRDPKAIRDGVVKLLNDKVFRGKLRMNGLKTAQAKKYTWDNVADRVEETLLGVLK